MTVLWFPFPREMTILLSQITIALLLWRPLLEWLWNGVSSSSSFTTSDLQFEAALYNYCMCTGLIKNVVSSTCWVSSKIMVVFLMLVKFLIGLKMLQFKVNR